MTTLGNKQTLNQFKQSGARGTLIQPLDFNIISAKLANENETQITSAGDMVVFVGGNNYLPAVREVLSTDTNTNISAMLRGFVIKNIKQGQYENAGNTVGVALENSIMLMMTENAVIGGDDVYYDARSAATAGFMEFVNLDVNNFKSISAGAINFVIDGVAKNLSSLDFSSAEDLSDVAGVLNTALSSVATATVDGTNNIMIKSATTGATSTVTLASTSGELYDALKAPLAITVDGEAAGVNTGKILANQTETTGLFKIGYALNDAPAGSLVKVYIKF